MGKCRELGNCRDIPPALALLPIRGSQMHRTVAPAGPIQAAGKTLHYYLKHLRRGCTAIRAANAHGPCPLTGAECESTLTKKPFGKPEFGS